MKLAEAAGSPITWEWMILIHSLVVPKPWILIPMYNLMTIQNPNRRCNPGLSHFADRVPEDFYSILNVTSDFSLPCFYTFSEDPSGVGKEKSLIHHLIGNSIRLRSVAHQAKCEGRGFPQSSRQPFRCRIRLLQVAIFSLWTLLPIINVKLDYRLHMRSRFRALWLEVDDT